MEIPFVDLVSQYKSIKSEIDAVINDVISNASFIGGSAVKDFEKNFANYIGTDHCVCCANGTDSLEILLLAMGIRPGDEVIVPAISWISTSEAVSTVGATPIFVDVHEELFTIDEDKINTAITPKTKAIIPVHLYGQAANMTAIMDIAKKHGLKVLEDCAQAHGAKINNRVVGTFGDCASYSFYPGKNLGAYGDAGAMLTNDKSMAIKARMIANHGQLKKHNHQIEGRNSRMDGLQAAILNVKLKYLDDWTASRIKVAGEYDSMLNNEEVIKPKVRKVSKHVFHLYVIKIDRRDELKSLLHSKGISTAIHYPKALPFLKCYESQGHKEDDFPVASKLQNQILSLPIYPELSTTAIKEITSIINNF